MGIRVIYLILPMILMTLNSQAQCQDKFAFMIGECQEQYQNMSLKHKISLLEVCDNSMDNSYKEWTNAMKDVENYCLSKGFDIKGCKLWINAFWDKNGNLKALIFHPKPNSKNADYDKLKGILSEYVENHSKVLKTHTLPYSHYGSISFPVYYQAIEGQN